MSQFQFGNFENRGGGVSIFQKCPNLVSDLHVNIAKSTCYLWMMVTILGWWPGGVKKTEMSQFQFGNYENRGGGSLFFKNVPISMIWWCNLQYYLYKKCLTFKNVPIWSEGGSTFFKNVWNSKMSQRSEGEGSTLIGTLSQIFSIFYFDASPKRIT